MYKVAVLMSTYNGEKYLREQIESILAQKDIDLKLYIRDDGSSDSTIQIVREYLCKTDKITLNIGANVGVGNSFMQLVYDCPDDYDYYAFADQDDVWLPEKIIRAINKIAENKTPVLYCSNQIVVDKNLNKIGMRHIQLPDISYQQIMCQNKITGCTMVWNRALQELLADKYRRPSTALLKNRIHDVWVAMVSSVIGEIIYDNEGYILYRQHESNVVGVRKTNIFKQWTEKINDASKRNGRSSLCKEVYEKYKDLIMNESIKKQLDIYSYYTSNIKYKKAMLADKEIIKHTNESQLEYQLKVLFNLI